jgi:hypothetical protein
LFQKMTFACPPGREARPALCHKLAERGDVAGPVSGRVGVGHVLRHDRLPSAGMASHRVGALKDRKFFKHRGFSLE